MLVAGIQPECVDYGSQASVSSFNGEKPSRFKTAMEIKRDSWPERASHLAVNCIATGRTSDMQPESIP